MSTFNFTKSVAIAVNFYFTILLPFIREQYGYGHFVTEVDAVPETRLDGDGPVMRRTIKINRSILILLEQNRSGDWLPVYVSHTNRDEQYFAFPSQDDLEKLSAEIANWRVKRWSSFEGICSVLIPDNVIPAFASHWRDTIGQLLLSQLSQYRNCQ